MNIEIYNKIQKLPEAIQLHLLSFRPAHPTAQMMNTLIKPYLDKKNEYYHKFFNFMKFGYENGLRNIDDGIYENLECELWKSFNLYKIQHNYLKSKKTLSKQLYKYKNSFFKKRLKEGIYSISQLRIYEWENECNYE